MSSVLHALQKSILTEKIEKVITIKIHYLSLIISLLIMYHHHPPDWYCKGCNQKIFGSKDKCSKCNLGKHDWICLNCSDKQFARNTECRKCKKPKGWVPTEESKPAPASAIAITPAVPKGGRAGDWLCPKCNVVIWASKDKCKKCDTPKPTATVTENKEKDDKEDTCAVCFDKPKEIAFKHGPECHLACCTSCAKIIMDMKKPCPICNMPTDGIIKVFNA
ncbi:MAG: E3 ubiquitin-protein ligase Mdm2 [Edafosvirus sp.]|uniref:E3 ubiquitin-protein ligase Mdm2 n=1 Tax=Edafosvirus sp. TaxID=2487765 RepID=A0A3G4ZU42_9VIRU|nr:MAG: E3 ubiquitin-protein ligase Mdm2 [Edafosvirus sp.]